VKDLRLRYLELGYLGRIWLRPALLLVLEVEMHQRQHNLAPEELVQLQQVQREALVRQ
jgi:hypothetical protein